MDHFSCDVFPKFVHAITKIALKMNIIIIIAVVIIICFIIIIIIIFITFITILIVIIVISSVCGKRVFKSYTTCGRTSCDVDTSIFLE